MTSPGISAALGVLVYAFAGFIGGTPGGPDPELRFALVEALHAVGLVLIIVGSIGLARDVRRG